LAKNPILFVVELFTATYLQTFKMRQSISQRPEGRQDVPHPGRKFPYPQMGIVFVLGSLIALLALGLLSLVPGLSATVAFILSLVLLASLWMLATVTFGATSAIAVRLSEQRLQTVGFIASAIGASTQFIPPLLNILNIKIGR
jgi:hypothetical protein